MCQRQYLCTLLRVLRRSRHVRMVAKPDLFELVSLSFAVPFSKYLLLIFKHSSLQFYRLEFFLSLIRTDKYLRLEWEYTE